MKGEGGTARKKLTVSKVGAEQGVAQFRALRHIRPVDHGSHGDHVVCLARTETSETRLVAAETGLLVVADGEVARRVQGHDGGDDAADGWQLSDGHWMEMSAMCLGT